MISMNQVDQMVDSCPGFGYSSDCTRDQMIEWIHKIWTEAYIEGYQKGQQNTMKWVSKTCQEQTKRIMDLQMSTMVDSIDYQRLSS